MQKKRAGRLYTARPSAMKDSSILSTMGERLPRPAAPQRERALLFDVCQIDVALRAVLYVELVLAVAQMYHAGDVLEWLVRFALLTSAALPATLAWLAALCVLTLPSAPQR